VAEGVAEVQHRAQAAFALVAPHHVGLDLAGAQRSHAPARRVARHQLADVRLDPVEEGGSRGWRRA
jgi:hypothetical protein